MFKQTPQTQMRGWIWPWGTILLQFSMWNNPLMEQKEEPGARANAAILWGDAECHQHGGQVGDLILGTCCEFFSFPTKVN